MMVKTPFFIYPAYCVPRITIVLVPKSKATEVSELIPGMFLAAWNYPALKML
jgi:hypothetical protein